MDSIKPLSELKPKAADLPSRLYKSEAEVTNDLKRLLLLADYEGIIRRVASLREEREQCEQALQAVENQNQTLLT